MKPNATPPNPRGKKVEKPNGPPGLGGGRPFRWGSPLAYVLLLVLGFLLFRNVFQDAGVRRVTYSQFKDGVTAGKFIRVQLAPDWVKGFLPEGTASAPASENGQPTAQAVEPAQLPWMANRVQNDPELIKTLDQKGIDYEAVGQSGLGDVFWIWIVPLGLAFLFWSFMMRRVSG